MEFSAHSITFGTEVKKLGFDVFWDAERPSITTVKPGSEAESRGIRPGDILAKVNGTATIGRKKDDLLKVLKGRPLDLVLDRQVIPAVDDEGSSSGEDEPTEPAALPKRSSGEQRHQADLALLAASRTRAGPSSPGSAAGSSPPSRRRAAARRRVPDEDSAEEDAPAAHTIAARFNADMGLLHKANQRCVQASYAKGRSGAKAEEDLQADADLARKMQEELDAQEKAKAAEAAETRQRDANLAKVLQEQFDTAAPSEKEQDKAGVDAESPVADTASKPAEQTEVEPGELSKEEPKEAAPFTLQIIVPEDAVPGTVLTVQAPDGQMVQATVPPECVPGDPLLIHVDPLDGEEEGEVPPEVMPVEEAASEIKSDPAGSPSQATDSVPNLIGVLVGSTCSMDGWESRVRRLSTTGISCSKVGRSGKLYQRTFWMACGCLRMNGRFAAAIPLNSIRAIYKEPNSADFRKLSSSKAPQPSILRRSSTGSTSKAGSPGKGGSHLNSDLCCVVSSAAKVLSLIFHDQRDRDDFAETIAWCIQNTQEKDADKTGA